MHIPRYAGQSPALEVQSGVRPAAGLASIISNYLIATRIFFLVLLLIAPLAFGATAVPDPAAAPPLVLPMEVAPNWWAKAQEDLREAEYAITAAEEPTATVFTSIFQAPNRAHGFRTYFEADGVRVIPRETDRGDWSFRLTLEAIRAGEQTTPVAAPERVVAGNRIEYRRGPLTEWYVNDDQGLEQGFTLEASPIADAAEISLALAMQGELAATVVADGKLELTHAEQGVVLHLQKLLAYDANGKDLPARFETSGNQLLITVAVAGAAYPIVIDPLVTSPGNPLEANQVNGGFGGSVAGAGDVNGDGYADVIIGATVYDNGQTDEGAAFVYMGSATGLATTPAWQGESNQSGSEYGIVASAGDVNGDGYTDVIVGANGYDNGQTDEGMAFVYHGSSSGLSTTPSWQMEINQAGAMFARYVSGAGDVNGDGYDDVVISAHGYDNGETNEGAAFVYLGSASGLASTAAWQAESNQSNASFSSPASAGDVNGDGYGDILVSTYVYDNGQTDEGAAFLYLGSASGLAPTPAWQGEGNQASAFYGAPAVSAGDVNGDGFGDVLVGAEGFDNGQTDEGAAFLYLGSAAGLSPTAAWQVEGNQAFAYYRNVSAAGDVNGDGYSDVIVGANGYDNGQSNEGAAFLYLGSAAGLSATPSWQGESDQANSIYGLPVAAAGDINGDGYSDVLIGAPAYDNGQNDEGAAFVYMGSAAGLGTTSTWQGESNQSGSAYGYSLASAGDVNGDGYADVVIGAHQYDNGQADEGAAFMYLGSSTGLATAPAWQGEGNQAGAEYAGHVASAGDVNGDGYGDVIIAASSYDNGQTDEGMTFVYHGSSLGLVTTPSWQMEINQAVAAFGYASGAGDVNGDGYGDVIVGAVYYDNGQTDEGAAFVYLGSASGLASTAAWQVESNQSNSVFGLGASAGDVNGDGYGDVVIGARMYDNGQTDEGAAFLYLGSATGLAPTPAWQGEGNQANANYGSPALAAGDVNGDGFGDVLVGAQMYDNGQTDEGAAFLYLGSATGLSPTAAWQGEGNQAQAYYGGTSVAGAGDVNGDGYGDVIASAYYYDNGQSNEGAAWIYLGSAAGLSSTSSWQGESNQANARYGHPVATAGDVNGDGYSDVLVGAFGYDNDQIDEGAAFLYLGNDGMGRTLLTRQFTRDGVNPVAPWGGSPGGFTAKMQGFRAEGPGGVKLEVEVCTAGKAFGDVTCQVTRETDYTEVGGAEGPSVPLSLGIDLDAGAYRWRARTLYAPSSGSLQAGPWRYPNASVDSTVMRVTTDTDSDGFTDNVDNCQSLANLNQADTDADGQGDVCDSDDDNDTVTDGADNCPVVANSGQTNTDGDGLGDACDQAVMMSIAAGNNHSMAIHGNGTVRAWGDNEQGELGDGTNVNRSTPIQVGILSGMAAISAGVNSTVALKSDGTVWAWGTNGYGQLGDGTTTNRSTPVQVTDLSGATAIAAGNYHTVALKSDGTVRAWGDNRFGAVGDGTTTDRYTPVQIAGLNGVIKIAAGHEHTLALEGDGTVWSWGWNNYGQLGDGTTTDHSAPILVPGLTGVISISAGVYYTQALKSDGTAWAWGRNVYGQLGDGTTTNRLSPVQVTGLTGITAIAAGWGHTLALKTDGTVWAWGINRYGQLGDGTTTNRSSPVQVTGLAGVTAISVVGEHSLALKSDGTVWAWGWNSLSQLGDGTTANRTIPVAVLGSGGVGTLDLDVLDTDSDGIEDGTDNCPSISNASQINTDGDSAGDACDSDDDNDSVEDASDNCPVISNTTQTNTDGDSLGNACDADDDNDSVADGSDNCPVVANTSQTNTDGDGLGNNCDPDDDNDTVADGSDNCPLASNTTQTNTDGDSTGDACDADDDNDTVADGTDNCPVVSNISQTNTDGDGLGDDCDPDDDNDGVPDGPDAFPLDAEESADTDGDGVGNNGDNCPSAENADQIDADLDGVGDVCDGMVDSDADGVADSSDNCPLISNPSQDNLDGDSAGDVCDIDNDNDNVADGADNCPSIANTTQTNTDGDGQGNDCDTDDDNDGLVDGSDPFPLNVAPTISGTPATSVAVNSPYSFTPTANDPDKTGSLTFSILNKPAWATFNTATGKLSGTPAGGNFGTFAGIIISVSDGVQTASLSAFTVTVTDSVAPTVTAAPPGGTYNANQSVTLSCTDAGSGCTAIHLTTDGSTPTTGSPLYGSAISVTSNRTIRFLARDAAGNISGVQTAVYIIDKVLPTVSASPLGGAYKTSQNVTLTCTDSGSGCAAIYYTNDSSTPTESSPVYSAPISVTDNQTIKFLARDVAGNLSPVRTEVYVIDAVAPTVSAAPTGGTYTSNTSVTLTCVDTGSGCAATHYTTNGSTPTIGSPAYAAPLAVAANTTLKFFARDNAGNVSVVQTEVYVIDSTPPALTIDRPINGSVSDTITRIGGTFVDVDSGLSTLQLSITDGERCLIRNFAFSFLFDDCTQPRQTITVGSGDFDGTDPSKWSLLVSGTTWAGRLYTVTARGVDLAGNENTVNSSFTIYSENQDFTTLDLNLTASSIVYGGNTTAGVKLTNKQNEEANLSGNIVKLTVTDPEGIPIEFTVSLSNNGSAVVDFNQAGIEFKKKGLWSVRAGFAGTLALQGSQSAEPKLLVGQAAGYTVLIQGRIANQEGLKSHNLTTNRIYRTLHNRGFAAANIFYFNYDLDQPGVYSLPYKTEIQNTITGLAAAVNANPAPIYIILVDHGGDNRFFLDGNTVILPGELDGWLDALQAGLSGAAAEEPIVVINGSCYAGSFIDELTGPRRVIIASAAGNEESYKGPNEGVDDDGDVIRSGEFFIDELFKDLDRGVTIAEAFTTATDKTEAFTRKGDSAANTVNRYFDASVQHPLLEDDGDGVGSNALHTGTGDGVLATRLRLGMGADNDVNSVSNVERVTPTRFLAAGESSEQIYLVTYNHFQVSQAFLELRRPATELTTAGGTEQREAGFVRVPLNPPPNVVQDDQGDNLPGSEETYLREYSGFTDPGKYELFYFVEDNETGDLSPAWRSVVYKDRPGNTPPTAFNLLSPANNGETKSVLIFDWEDASDLDGVTYTLRIAKDLGMTDIVYTAEEITSSRIEVDDRAGLKGDDRTYYWDVQAIDRYGARRSSLNGPWAFQTNNQNNVPGILKGLVYSDVSYGRLASAQVTVSQGTLPPVSISTDSEGAYYLLAYSGDVVVTVTSAGYQNRVMALTVQPGATLGPVNVGLTPNAGGAEANVAIEVTATAGDIRVGDTITYTLTASNLGPDSATQVTLTQDLPGTASFVAAPGCGSPVTNTLICDLGSLASGASVQRSVSVIPHMTGSVTTAANVVAETFDPVQTNNTDELQIQVGVNLNGDTDGDGIVDGSDNCQLLANADQANADADGLGNVCDPDDDGDSLADGADNCPLAANVDQADHDSDSEGDACDPDDDNDGTPDVTDAFPLNNAETRDTDGDGVGNNADNCALPNSDQADSNGNGVGDVCDKEDDGFINLLPVIMKALEEQGNPP